MNDAKENVLTDGIQTFPDRTDRVYLNPQDCSVINDEALNRIIAVGHQHHLNVVGWNRDRRFQLAWAICRMMATKHLFV